MSEFVTQMMADVKAKNAAEPEFHQAVEEVAESLEPVLDKHPEYRSNKILRSNEVISPLNQIVFAWSVNSSLV